MYESLYGLSRRPFAPTPDLAFYVPNASAEAALDAAEHTIREDQGIGILTADVGLGKTLVCQQLASRLSDDYTVVFLPSANYPSSRALLQAILYEIGHPYTRLDEQELRLELQSALRELSEETRGLVLVVDEANFLSDTMLEEVRTLTHLAIDGVPLVRVVLSAHMSFEERLMDRQMEPLNQRIGCHVFLEPLTHEESLTYVAERLRLSGANVDDVLTPETMLAISQASGGVPRCLNQLCDHTLLLGYAMQEQPVSVDRVHEALEDLKPLPLQWNNLPSAPMPTEHLQFCEEAPAEEAADTEQVADPVEPADAVEEFSPESAETDVFEFDLPDEAAVFEFGPEADDDETVSHVESAESTVMEDSAVFEVGGDTPESISSQEIDSSHEAEPVRTVETWQVGHAVEEMESSVIEFGPSDEPAVHETIPNSPTDSNEHTVIVPPTPTWRESPATLETERIKQAVGPYAWSFAQEAVTDRYAALDAGRPLPKEIRSTATVSNCPTIQLRREESNCLQPEPSPFAQSPLPVEWLTDTAFEPVETAGMPSLHGDPLKTIDAILPQVDDALNDGIDSQVESAESVASSANAADVLQSVRDQIDSFHDSEPDLDLESEIGALVLDTCVSTQTELYGSSRNREVDQKLAAALEETLAEKLGHPLTEASESRVMPKQKSIAEQLAEAQDNEPEKPQQKRPRKYGSLFTKLRRKSRS